MKNTLTLLAAFMASLLIAGATLADTPAPRLSALARMPVKEVTIFKDGNALVRHEGDMPTDADGSVLMDYLPTPVLGTFWPYSADPKTRLVSVTSARRRVEVDRTALTLKEMFRANIGADVIVDQNGDKYSATIAGFPTRSSEEITRTSPPGADEQLPIESDIVLLKTNEGIKAVPFSQITEVTFKNGQNALTPSEEFRNLLTLRLGWQTGHAAPTAKVGLIYLQNGLKWVPSYRVTIDGSGNAHIELRATIVNDLTNLDDVSANLVIGVPTFKFAGTTDPMALQEEAAYRTPTMSYGMSNAIQSQVAFDFAGAPGEYHASPAATGIASGPGPAVTDSAPAEDLFVFTVSHLTLKRGQRIQIPVAEYDIKYKDVYKLTVPVAPPADLSMNYSYDQRQQLGRLVNAPHVIHAIRLMNDAKFPLTTAPALIMKNGSVLAQGMMTYTPIGDKSDLDITDAVDVPVTLKQHEVSRKPSSLQVDGFGYSRVDLAGSVCLTNYRDESIDLEVDRTVLGLLDTADHDGVVEQGTLTDQAHVFGDSLPQWWTWYNWPGWWNEVNGVGKVTWKVSLPAKKTVELGYNWHYFWR